MDLEEALKQLGAYGKYQILLWWFMAMMDSYPASWHMLAMTFIGYEPTHHCKVEGNESIPFVLSDGKLEPAKCKMYTNLTVNNDTSGCIDGWSYDTDVMLSSIASEWNLVCDLNYISEVSQSVYMAGLFLGGCVMGMGSDRFGRKKVMFVGFVMEGIAGIGVSFAPNVYVFTALRFIVGAFVVACNLTGFIVACEMFPAKQRSIFGTLHELQWSIGCCLLPGIAFALRYFGWRYLQLAISIASLLNLAAWWIVPESLPWLISKRRLSDAEAILERAAKFNGRQLPKLCLHDGVNNKKDDKPLELATPLSLFKTPRLRRITIVGSFFWFANVIVYYGLSQNAPNLNGDLYTNFFLLSVVEVPSLFLSVFLLYKFGRKYTTGALYLLCGVACIVLPFIPEKTEGGTDLNWITISIALLGKFCINAAFTMSLVYLVELFPTVIRATGFLFTNIFGRVGGVIYPYILYLNKTEELGPIRTSLPYLLFGGISIVTSVLVLLLPETRGRTLPETIEDVESDVAFKNQKKGLEINENGIKNGTKQVPHFSSLDIGKDNPSYEITKF